MQSKPVKLPPNVVTELEKVKKHLKLKSLGEAAEFLLGFSNSPISVVALALDMRNDIKCLLEELKKLNENLGKITKYLPEENQN